MVMRQGRPQSIPLKMWGSVFRLYSEGYGYRAIANLLLQRSVVTTKSSVERLIKGRPPYSGRRIRPESRSTPLAGGTVPESLRSLDRDPEV